MDGFCRCRNAVNCVLFNIFFHLSSTIAFLPAGWMAKVEEFQRGHYPAGQSADNREVIRNLNTFSYFFFFVNLIPIYCRCCATYSMWLQFFKFIDERRQSGHPYFDPFFVIEVSLMSKRIKQLSIFTIQKKLIWVRFHRLLRCRQIGYKFYAVNYN